MDLDTAIKCLSQNYKIFKDSGTGLEPVTLSIGDRMAGMVKMNERKAGQFLLGCLCMHCIPMFQVMHQAQSQVFCHIFKH